MDASSQTPPDGDQWPDVPDNPGVDREPEEVWDFTTVLTEDDFAPDARWRRAVRLDPDVLRALDREAGQ